MLLTISSCLNGTFLIAFFGRTAGPFLGRMTLPSRNPPDALLLNLRNGPLSRYQRGGDHGFFFCSKAWLSATAKPLFFDRTNTSVPNFARKLATLRFKCTGTGLSWTTINSLGRRLLYITLPAASSKWSGSSAWYTGRIASKRTHVPTVFIKSSSNNPFVVRVHLCQCNYKAQLPSC